MLYQTQEDGLDKFISFAGRTLSKGESNYAANIVGILVSQCRL